MSRRYMHLGLYATGTGNPVSYTHLRAHETILFLSATILLFYLVVIQARCYALNLQLFFLHWQA